MSQLGQSRVAVVVLQMLEVGAWGVWNSHEIDIHWETQKVKVGPF